MPHSIPILSFTVILHTPQIGISLIEFSLFLHSWAWGIQELFSNNSGGNIFLIGRFHGNTPKKLTAASAASCNRKATGTKFNYSANQREVQIIIIVAILFLSGKKIEHKEKHMFIPEQTKTH